MSKRKLNVPTTTTLQRKSRRLNPEPEDPNQHQPIRVGPRNPFPSDSQLVGRVKAKKRRDAKKAAEADKANEPNEQQGFLFDRLDFDAQIQDDIDVDNDQSNVVNQDVFHFGDEIFNIEEPEEPLPKAPPYNPFFLPTVPPKTPKTPKRTQKTPPPPTSKPKTPPPAPSKSKAPAAAPSKVASRAPSTLKTVFSSKTLDEFNDRMASEYSDYNVNYNILAINSPNIIGGNKTEKPVRMMPHINRITGACILFTTIPRNKIIVVHNFGPDDTIFWDARKELNLFRDYELVVSDPTKLARFIPEIEKNPEFRLALLYYTIMKVADVEGMYDFRKDAFLSHIKGIEFGNPQESLKRQIGNIFGYINDTEYSSSKSSSTTSDSSSSSANDSGDDEGDEDDEPSSKKRKKGMLEPIFPLNLKTFKRIRNPLP